MVKYQFDMDDEEWSEWKDTVPRSKSLDERIRELIAADTEGRVCAPGEICVPDEDVTDDDGDGNT